MSIDVFNLSVDDFNTASETPRWDSEIFAPDPKNGRDGVYSCKVRFIPWHKNPLQSTISVWSSWLTDPVTGKGRRVNCPSTVGQPSVLQNIWRKLRDSDSAADVELAKSAFSRRQDYYSLIQILEDENNPGNVGKLMVLRYGKKIKEKIDEEMRPIDGDPSLPFDIFTGHTFVFRVTRQGDWKNYDSSKFGTRPTPPLVRDSPSAPWRPATVNDKELVLELLQNGPDLEKYSFKPWDADTEQFVRDVIRNTVPNGRIVEAVLGRNAAATATAAPAARAESLPHTASEEIDDILSASAAPAPTPGVSAPPQSAEDFEEDLFANL